MHPCTAKKEGSRTTEHGPVIVIAFSSVSSVAAFAFHHPRLSASIRGFILQLPLFAFPASQREALFVLCASVPLWLPFSFLRDLRVDP